jgi:hypothetical protein
VSGSLSDALRRILMWATPVGRDYDEDTALTEIRRIAREALADGPTEPTYPKTPVDCLISELRDAFGMNGRAYLIKSDFDERVAQFNAEVAE